MDSGKKKKIFKFFAFILLISAVIGIVVGVNLFQASNTQSLDDIRASTALAIVNSSCSITLHPDLCNSTFSDVPEITQKIKSSKDVIELGLNKTKQVIQRNHFTIKKLITTKTDLIKRKKLALHDCLEMVDATLEQLDEVIGLLNTYPKKKSIRRYYDDLITLMSTTMTNQATCIDGIFESDQQVQLESLISDEIHAKMMCSNSLAMIKNMSDTDMAKEAKMNRWAIVKEEDARWPEWLSEEDRVLLLSKTVTPNVVVAADGSGDFTTISDAVDAAPNRSETRYIIGIAKGTYRENVEVISQKWNLMFLGSGQESTIVTANHSVAGGWGTFNSFTVAAVGKGFLARDITFQNYAGPNGSQAVALRVGSDCSAFYRCGMIGYQDTLYVHSNRQFYVKCYIAGTIDFIFGYSSALFQDCDIHARKPNKNQKNMVTADGRDDPNKNTGIVIQKSRIGATSDLYGLQKEFPTYLGRPWGNHSRTVVMQTNISDVIHPDGWAPWNSSMLWLDTLYYAEYDNVGEGANTSNRVTWSGYHVLTDASEVEPFTAENFVDGADWLPDTGFPYSLGL